MSSIAGKAAPKQVGTRNPTSVGKRNPKRHRALALTLIGLAVALFVGGGFILDWFLVLELKTLDTRFQARGEVGSPQDVVIVAIDDASFREMQLQWPWPRAVHGELVQRLHEAGAGAILFDVLFLEPSRLGAEDDAALSAAAQQAGNVIFGYKLTHVVDQQFRTTVVERPIPELREASWALGMVNHPPDPDRFARRSYLFQRTQDEFHPTLSLAGLAHYTGLSLDLLAFDAAEAIQEGGRIQVDDEHIRLLPEGPFAGTYFINYWGGPRAVRTVSYYQVLAGEVPEEWLADKIVLIGAVTPDLDDLFATPFMNMGLMPGVEVHANAIMTLLDGNPLQVPPPWVTLLLVGLTTVGGAWLCGRTSAFKGFLAASGIVAGIIVYAMWSFSHQDLWLQIVPPVLGMMLTYTLVNAYRFAVEERERNRVAGVFGRYVSKDVVDQIMESDAEIPLGGIRQQATVLFTDIRGFTSMSEKMAPEEVVDLLNEYFEVMNAIIFRHKGTIDKFMGDAIMAIWGAPVPRAGDAERAVRAAVDMRQALHDLREKWMGEGKPFFDTGIGLNTDEVVVGNIGSSLRMEYTVIGDGVNLASRIEGLTKDYGGGIVIAENTCAEVEGVFEMQTLPSVQVKGKAKPVALYKVLGVKGETWRDDPAPPESLTEDLVVKQDK